MLVNWFECKKWSASGGRARGERLAAVPAWLVTLAAGAPARNTTYLQRCDANAKHFLNAGHIRPRDQMADTHAYVSRPTLNVVSSLDTIFCNDEPNGTFQNNNEVRVLVPASLWTVLQMLIIYSFIINTYLSGLKKRCSEAKRGQIIKEK